MTSTQSISIDKHLNFIAENLSNISPIQDEPQTKLQGRLIYKLQDRFDGKGDLIKEDNSIAFKDKPTDIVGKRVQITINERLGFPFSFLDNLGFPFSLFFDLFRRRETLSTTTDNKGRFSITSAYSYSGNCDIKVRIFSRINPLSKKEDGIREIASVTLNLSSTDSKTLALDFGQQQINHLPYREEDLPRAKHDDEAVFPNEPSFNYQWRLLNSVLGKQATTFMKDMGIPCYTPKTYEDVNKIFNIVDPDFEITEEEVLDMLLNRTGQAPARKTDNPNIIAFHYSVSQYDREDPDQGGPICPDVTLNCKFADNKITALDSIKVIHNGTEYIRTPEDGDQWLHAMRLYLTVAAIRGQFHNHLVRHLWTEGIYLAALRTFDKSPLKDLIYAFCKDLLWINREGEVEIFMNQGVLGQSPLTEQGILESQIAAFGWTDWKNWQPRNALGSNDLFPQQQQYFWDNFCIPHIDRFFEENMSGILQHKEEVYNFSRELVKISFPATQQDQVDDQGIWLDTSELLKEEDNATRLRHDGITKAITPLLQHQGILTEENIDDFKQFFRYLYIQVMPIHDNFHRNLRMDLARGCGVLAPYNLGETPYLDTPLNRYWHQIDITARLTDIGLKETESETAVNDYHQLLPEYFTDDLNDETHQENYKALGGDLKKMLRSVIY